MSTAKSYQSFPQGDFVGRPEIDAKFYALEGKYQALEKNIAHHIRERSFLIEELKQELFEKERHIEEIQEKNNKLTQELKAQIQIISESQDAISEDLHHYLICQYLGGDLQNIQLSRFLPIRVYLSDDEYRADKVTNSISQLLNTIEFTFEDDFPPMMGSWLKKWFAKSTEAMTQPQVID